MIKKHHLSIIIALIIGTAVHPAAAKEVIPDKNQPLSSQINKGSVTYVITDEFDLNGETLILPQKCILSFKGGRIVNGTLHGNQTEIRGEKTLLFRNISITGDFQNKTVYSHWFELSEAKADNKKIFDAIMALANGNTHTDVYIQKGNYHTSVGGHGNGIRIPSNTSVHNEATISALPSSLEKYNVITIKDVINVVFDGGKIIGDVGSHQGNTGEWGYGIALTGARNATVKNVTVTRCWGDGINVQALYEDYLNKTIDGHCYNIRIENVICDDNRRQGMSIEGCIGIYVTDSRFINTGQTQATLPTAGIDIEPWFDTEVVQDITISDCEFSNNKGGNLIAPLTRRQWENRQCRNFVIRNNRFDDNAIRFNRTRNVTFENNSIGSESGLLEFNQYDGINIISNKIYGKVSIYTESGSRNGKFCKNTVFGNERQSLAIEVINDNTIHGSIALREGVPCTMRGNHIHADGISDEYSLICDNTDLTMYGNILEIGKPMIFRYKSHMDIFNNQFKVISDIQPACMILQTARNDKKPEDGRIFNNIMTGKGKLTVNYSSKGKYTVSDNINTIISF